MFVYTIFRVMSSAKTFPTKKSVKDFLKSIDIDKRRTDGFVLFDLMKDITKENPVMWGKSIVGFGSVHYKYKSGREGNWFKVGFSPRKRSLSVYFMTGFDKLKDLLEKVGKHRLGVGCLYINKLEDINLEVLKQIVKRSLEDVKKADYLT
jgi:hypothetical protein